MTAAELHTLFAWPLLILRTFCTAYSFGGERQGSPASEKLPPPFRCVFRTRKSEEGNQQLCFFSCGGWSWRDPG
ncbi:hypothetical protein V8C44DRAFT_326877 [Trichoderma aethiopicum]